MWWCKSFGFSSKKFLQKTPFLYICLLILFKNQYPSALDKLLGQLGIYATWLSSIAYLQKQLRIFIFLCHVFFLRLHVFLLHKAIGNLLAYLFTPIVCFLKCQNNRFIVPEANLIPLLTFERVLTFIIVFFCEMLDWTVDTGILFIKLELYCVASIKKSIPDLHLFITQMETKWTK